MDDSLNEASQHEVSAAGTPPALRDSTTRIVIDDEFREWRVREVAAPAYDRRRGTVLIFDTVGIARRVREFPPNWRELSDAALIDLSDSLATPLSNERLGLPADLRVES